MKNFLILILISINCIAYADTKISAELMEEPLFGEYHGYSLTGFEVHKHSVEFPHTFFFPAKHYDIDPFYCYKLNVSSQDNSKKLKFTDEDRISAYGSLDLVSYDEKSGYFKFKLTIYPKTIDHEYDSVVHEGTFKTIKGILTFDHNKKTEMIIEGQAIITKDNVKFVTFNTSENEFFELAIETTKEVYLKQKNPVPVTINLYA